MIEVRRVGTERREELASTLTSAFEADPFLGWVLAESGQPYAQALARWWQGALAAMAGAAVFHATQDSSAAAVWLPPQGAVVASGSEPLEEEPNAFVQLVSEVCGVGAGERLRFFGELSHMAPEEPHWHLTAVGVVATEQGRGLGQKVLAPMLSQCDRLGQPAYLEASTPRSRLLYERLGFEFLRHAAPPDGPELALMWRQPS